MAAEKVFDSIATKDIELKRITLGSSAIITPIANGTSALSINNAAGTSILNIDSTNSRVGISLSTPLSKFHVQDSAVSSGAVPDSVDLVTIERNGSHYINLLTPATNESGLNWSDTVRARGLLVYSHLNDYMYFSTAGTERMRLNATGLGIGTTGPTELLSISGGNLSMHRGASTTAPTTPSASGGVLYISGGQLNYINANGVSTKLAN